MIPNPSNPELTRRRFLRRTAAGALLAGLPAGWSGRAFADDSPESPNVRFGIIALTDCSPIVIAHEKGFFKKHGINSSVSKEASWAVIRDKLQTGDNQATHMLLGMPIASTMGLGGSVKKPMVFPWILNRNGQGITLKSELAGKVKDDPKALKNHVDKAKGIGEPLTFAMTFPPGTHAMWMRYFLAAGGINPDKDVNLITIPPPQMVANMKVGKMDGFCVGEPWNARAIADKIGFTAISTQDIWKDHHLDGLRLLRHGLRSHRAPARRRGGEPQRRHGIPGQPRHGLSQGLGGVDSAAGARPRHDAAPARRRHRTP